MEPKVSIVIPVYNVKKYLRDCVESVKNQTYRNLEILIIDDGSTDGSSELCDEIAKTDARIEVIHKPNAGLSDARNAGFDHAAGKYIYYLDSDDYIKEWAINDLVDLAENTGVDAVFFDAYIVDENENQVLDEGSSDKFYRTGNYNGIYTGKQLFERFINYGDYSSAVPLIFFRKEAIRYRFLSILHEDELFTIQLLFSINSTMYYPVRLYVRRNRNDSITRIRKTVAHYNGVIIVIRNLCGMDIIEDALKRNIARLYNDAIRIYNVLPEKERDECLCNDKELYRIVVRKKITEVRSPVYSKTIAFFHNIYMNMWSGIKNGFRWGRRRLSFLKKRWRYIRILKRIRKDSANTGNVFLIGTPVHGNLGDHAIAEAEKRFLGTIFSRVYEIEMPFYVMCSDILKKYIRQQDLIVVSGGGWMGNQWIEDNKVIQDIVTTYSDKRVVIFPQTIYYEECDQKECQIEEAKQIFSKSKNAILCLRDKKSYDFAFQNDYKNIFYVPDIALYLKCDSNQFRRHGVLIIKREDREKAIEDAVWINIVQELCSYNHDVSYANTIFRNVSPEERERVLRRKLVEISQAKVIVTDRLHAMVFAAITATPCIALDNTSQKVSGVYQWIKDLEYIELAHSVQDVIRFVKSQMDDDRNYHYTVPDYTALRDILMNIGQ